MTVYFDNAATTPLEPQVAEAMHEIMRNHFGNPSSIHSQGRKSRALIEAARRKVADHFFVSPGEIFFTSGGTEADNMALLGACRDLQVKHIITSPIEHHAVLHTSELLAKAHDARLSMVKLGDSGHLDYNHLEELLQEPGPTLVSLMHANNEIGNLLSIKVVAELCQKYGAWFHSDTVQTVGHYPINLKEIPAHFITCGAHKFHGPKGVGFLYVSSDVKIGPMIHGGGQERNMRGGTENIYGIIGLSKALDIALDQVGAHQQYVQGLKSEMMHQLERRIDGVRFNGDAAGSSLYTVLNVCFPHTPRAEMLLYNLDIWGIAASAGSACTSGTNLGSHVLQAIGTDLSRPSIRFSFSKYNTIEEVNYVVDKLEEEFCRS